MAVHSCRSRLRRPSTGRACGFPLLALLTLLALAARVDATEPSAAHTGRRIDLGGRLQASAVDGRTLGDCPLEHTDVRVEIAGHLVRVQVEQVFINPFDEKIEAVYTFPLSHRAAVDRMRMTVENRVIDGEVWDEDQARRIYESARNAGHVAALLEQERPNIFTQSVANIEPHKRLRVEISYIEVASYADGRFTFSFPMVVAPRYIPGATGSIPGTPPPSPSEFSSSTGSSPTDPAGPNAPGVPAVPDAGAMTPMPVPPEFRAGHDISLYLSIDTGGPPITEYASPSHDVVRVDRDTRDGTHLELELARANEIPNRDFVLHWRTGDVGIREALFTHWPEPGAYPGFEGGFFALVLQPPERVVDRAVPPREVVFVLDVSGSMRGFPLEKSKALMSRALEAMRPEDRFNVVTFAGRTGALWKHPRPATATNIDEAWAFVEEQRGSGGTEMMAAIEEALAADHARRMPRDSMRIVVFLTDGLVGNDNEIIAAVERHRGSTRVFCFGVGNSVNRFLLDGMARAGRGRSEIVLLEEDAEIAVDRMVRRIQTPVLTDIELEPGPGLDLVDVLPGLEQGDIPDLFDFEPLVLFGRYRWPSSGVLTIRGLTGKGRFERRVTLSLPDDVTSHDVVATLWARKMVEVKTVGKGGAERDEDLRRDVVELGETFQIMTPYTSFVAVAKARVTVGGVPRLVRVPVEFPDGMSWEGVYGRLPGEEGCWLGGDRDWNWNRNGGVANDRPELVGALERVSGRTGWDVRRFDRTTRRRTSPPRPGSEPRRSGPTPPIARGVAPGVPGAASAHAAGEFAMAVRPAAPGMRVERMSPVGSLGMGLDATSAKGGVAALSDVGMGRRWLADLVSWTGRPVPCLEVVAVISELTRAGHTQLARQLAEELASERPDFEPGRELATLLEGIGERRTAGIRRVAEIGDEAEQRLRSMWDRIRPVLRPRMVVARELWPLLPLADVAPAPGSASTVPVPSVDRPLALVLGMDSVDARRLDELRRLGFDVEDAEAELDLVVGTITAPEVLSALVELEGVRRVEPL